MDDSPEEIQPEKNQPDRTLTSVTTFDPALSDLGDIDIFIDEYLLPKTEFQLSLLNLYTEESLLFSNLDELERNTLLKAMNVLSFEENDYVFKIGDIADNFYIVRTGKFNASDHEDFNIRGYFKSDLICEAAMLFPYVLKFNIQALCHASVWYINREIFRRIKLALLTRKRKLHEKYLSAIPLFSQLHTSDFMNLADCLQTISFKKGEFIYKQQSCSDGLYIVEKGIVHMCVLDDEGKQIVLTVIKKGGHFGERSMITCNPRKTSAFAANDVVVALLLVETFERLKGFCKDIANQQDINEIFGSGINIFTLREF